MNPVEAQEIAQIPPKYRPLSMWAFFGYAILFNIPIVGFICTIVFSFSDYNICRRNFARSYFCVIIIFFVLTAIASCTGALGSLTASTGSGAAYVSA